MLEFTSDSFSIRSIIDLWDKNQLILQPKFQRRAAWGEAARSYLIDTVIRRYPMPKIYLRRIVNPDTQLKAYEVVDGQQRLRAIIDFFKNKLVLDIKHNPDFGDSTFNSLPESIRREMAAYKITTEIVESASDADVWALFERLNTYTLTLNTQEKLNAKYFGYFKQTAYQLAAEQDSLNLWKILRVCNDKQISRMKEVELSSDVLVAIVEGISDKSAIGAAYKKYDDEFPMRDNAAAIFRNALTYIKNELRDPVKSTRFHNISWFYSIMVATADALAGIPKGNGRRPVQHKDEICERMYFLHNELRRKIPILGLSDFANTRSRATGHIRERNIRHYWFYNMLTLSGPDWHRSLQTLLDIQ